MELYPYFHIAPKLLEAAQRAEELARPQFREIESIQRYNQQKMLAAFNRAGVSESHFVGSTGYGYGDRGRDVLDQVYAYAFGNPSDSLRHSVLLIQNHSIALSADSCSLCRLSNSQTTVGKSDFKLCVIDFHICVPPYIILQYFFLQYYYNIIL